MIQTITTLFVTCTLSSASRLLLQQPPMYVPATEAPVNIPPVTIPPANVPVNIPPANVPEYTPPVTNYGPPNTQPNMQLAPAKMECKFSPPDINTCSNRMTTVTDPGINFDLTCSAFEGCMGSVINIVYTQFTSPHLEAFKGFFFTNDYAAANAQINFINNRPGNKILIDQVKCDKPGACMNTQFIIGERMEIEIGDFYCAPGACNGCLVKEYANGPGIPCIEFTEPI